MARLCWFAARRKQRLPPLPCPNEGAPEAGYALEYLRHYQHVRGPMGGTSRTRARLAHGMDNDFFMQTKSKLLHQLRQGEVPFTSTLFQTTGEGRAEGFALHLPAEAIRYGKVAEESEAVPNFSR